MEKNGTKTGRLTADDITYVLKFEFDWRLGVIAVHLVFREREVPRYGSVLPCQTGALHQGGLQVLQVGKLQGSLCKPRLISYCRLMAPGVACLFHGVLFLARWLVTGFGPGQHHHSSPPSLSWPVAMAALDAFLLARLVLYPPTAPSVGSGMARGVSSRVVPTSDGAMTDEAVGVRLAANSRKPCPARPASSSSFPSCWSLAGRGYAHGRLCGLSGSCVALPWHS